MRQQPPQKPLVDVGKTGYEMNGSRIGILAYLF